MTRTIEQNKRMHALFAKLKFGEGMRASFAISYSDYRTAHTSELTYEEAGELIKKLEALCITEDKANTMRRRIISMAHEMGWELPELVNGKPKIDMDRVYAWVEKYGYLKKSLMKYSDFELPKLVTQMEKVHASYLKKLSKLRHEAV